MAKKNCIMCDSTAGSHEHVFPAVLGGRRTNKGIYCTPHNNAFGRHVAELEKQLSMFNAILKVRPDRRDAPKSFTFTDTVGDNFSMLGQSIQTAPPPSLNQLGHQHGASVALKFGSMEQFETWKEEQRKSGWDVRIADGSREMQEHHFASPVSIQLRFGGHDALQAVGYLALTFFAQYFPDEVRSKEFEPFKDFLKLDFSKDEDKSGWRSNLVWWDGRDTKEVAGQNPFQFGHSIIIGTSASKKRAYAYVSFFSSLNFGIDLGPINDAHEQMVCVFIDPTAEKAPNDWKVIRSDTFSIEVDPATSDLTDMIQSGSAEAAIGQFLRKVGEWHFNCFIREIEEDLKKWTQNRSIDAADFAGTLVHAHRQRVLNVLLSATTGIAEQFKQRALPATLITILDKLIEADDSQPNGISKKTNDVLEIAKKKITEAVKHELSKQRPNSEVIASLIGNTEGIFLVTKEVVQPILLNSL
ncbi:HNH endonuclease [Burkholderia ubonensis]|uniref:HNH endonuclease n=1 Tax=Burkholderia ubonensis TaxID=101571 RepID=UPI0005D96D76|nr:HNH endonuclease [Burkholderia ubonensis]AJX14053.1 hypothetical protein BW23_4851 [Burkholderia ubonensis MSMB22]